MHGIKATLSKAHQALKDADIDHALIGGLALSGLGVHRATIDVDLLMSGSHRERAIQTLLKCGFVLETETPEVLHFSGYGRLDILLSNRVRSREMLANAIPLPTLNINCLRAEDIIGLKIQAYINNPKRALQDKADIAALIEKHPHLDWVKIKDYAELFSQWPTLQRLRKQYEL